VSASCRSRGAPRLRRGATNAWGSGGHLGAPDIAHTVTEDRDGSAGAVPSVWGSGGHLGAPDIAHTVTEDRDGSAGAVPSVWGSGGHLGAPSYI
jgi:hypothetical protein